MSRPLFKDLRLICLSIFTGSRLSLGLEGFGIVDPDQSSLSQPGNNTIIMENEPAAAVLCFYTLFS